MNHIGYSLAIILMISILIIQLMAQFLFYKEEMIKARKLQEFSGAMLQTPTWTLLSSRKKSTFIG
jgi:hypothetical protein